ncbi:hypothetical protein ACWIB8_11675 [Corynebacterium flavescens]
MTNSLIITTNYGTETDELLTPLQALKEAGVRTTVASVGGNEIQTLRGDKTAGPVIALSVRSPRPITILW